MILIEIVCTIKQDFNHVWYTDQVIIAQWLAQRLATVEVPGSNHGKDDIYYFLTKKEI